MIKSLDIKAKHIIGTDRISMLCVKTHVFARTPAYMRFNAQLRNSIRRSGMFRFYIEFIDHEKRL